MSNPSTGYHWVAEYNKNKVILLAHSFKVKNPNLAGSPGIETFVFIGQKGQKINKKYIKNGDKKPLEEVTYTL